MNIAVHDVAADTGSLIRQASSVCGDYLEKLKAEYATIPEVSPFIEIIRKAYEPEMIASTKPKVILFGTDFPQEILHALTGQCAVTILGGSRIYIDASDDSVPRDTDPVTRSMLGQLYVAEPYWRASALVVVPCSSDAQRKAAYLLSERGWNVVTVWIPSVKDEDSRKAYRSEIDHAVGTICRHIGKRWSSASLHKSAVLYESVRTSVREFLAVVLHHEDILPGPLRMAVMDSFFLTDNIVQWQKDLNLLTVALSREEQNVNTCPRVLLIGSPIYVPNAKIPFLLHDSGIGICGCIDSRDAQTESMLELSKRISLKSLENHYFNSDSSPAFVNNEQLTKTICAYIQSTKPDGIIWHVLKGQIEYDFELNRAEKIFEEYDLPVIRLETDYQYQDIEQLRIRIEAFAELLRQKKLEKGASCEENRR